MGRRFLRGIVRGKLAPSKIVTRRGSIDEGTLSETKSANYTVDAQDSGKVINIDTDAKIMTLPATALGLTVTFRNIGADGGVAINLSPNASDQIIGADLSALDDKDLINTKATAKYGDFVTLIGDGADGWYIQSMQGTWAREA